MATKLTIAVPSKGRLKDQAADLFEHAGMALRKKGHERGYNGALAGLEGVEVVFVSAAEIVHQLRTGRVHLGVTGEDLIRESLADVGRRLRVATKYMTLTRRFFAAHSITGYRIVESVGSTEATPATGTAELIVDITTTGMTLRANHLKLLDDGLILKSQAHLLAARAAPWSPAVTKLRDEILVRLKP